MFRGALRSVVPTELSFVAPAGLRGALRKAAPTERGGAVMLRGALRKAAPTERGGAVMLRGALRSVVPTELSFVALRSVVPTELSFVALRSVVPTELSFVAPAGLRGALRARRRKAFSFALDANVFFSGTFVLGAGKSFGTGGTVAASGTACTTCTGSP
jgi:hypothetical protein